MLPLYSLHAFADLPTTACGRCSPFLLQHQPTYSECSYSFDLTCCISSLSVLQVFNKEEGNISPHMANLRADMGKAATDLTTMQTFDGPGPETINGEQQQQQAALAVALGMMKLG